MKKTYIIPATMLVRIAPSTIIAASLNGVGPDGGTTTLTDEEAESGTAAWARGRNIWDDED